MNESDFRTGDIILVKGFVNKEHYLARLIAIFQLLGKKLRGQKVDKIYVHSANVVKEFGKYYIYEMKPYGVRRVLLSYFLKKRKDITVKRHVPQLTYSQERKFIDANQEFYYESTRYYFAGIGYFAIYLLTGIWLGEKYSNDKDRQVCSEFSGVCFNSSIKNTFEKTYKLTPTDIDTNINFKTL